MDITTEEKDAILNQVSGGLTLKEMTGITFYKWALRKLNGQPSNDKRVSGLTAQVSSMPPHNLPEDEKINIFLRLKEMGINTD